ncbi:MAG TPA: DUF6748 domain-containing protein [Kofleriaceae bacterium]
MLSRIAFAAFALTAPILTACTDQVDDELDTNDATEGDASKADAPGSTYTYYFVKPDIRRCASPVCGGVFYRLANADTTRCIDGKKAEQCYAASADWSRLGLGETGMAKVNDALYADSFGQGTTLLVRAVVGTKDWGNGLGSFANLRPSEAWIAQGPNDAAGPLAKIEDSGVRCITAPCPSLREKKLNSAIVQDIADLGWDKSGANDRLIGTALDQMHTTGLIVSGYRYTVHGPAGDAKARSVTQFWLRAVDSVAEKTCYVGGCSGQVCSEDQGVITTCEWQPQYACYHTATCELQSDGNCGWTQTAELQACLANP